MLAVVLTWKISRWLVVDSRLYSMLVVVIELKNTVRLEAGEGCCAQRWFSVTQCRCILQLLKAEQEQPHSAGSLQWLGFCHNFYNALLFSKATASMRFYISSPRAWNMFFLGGKWINIVHIEVMGGYSEVSWLWQSSRPKYGLAWDKFSMHRPGFFRPLNERKIECCEAHR